MCFGVISLLFQQYINNVFLLPCTSQNAISASVLSLSVHICFGLYVFVPVTGLRLFAVFFVDCCGNGTAWTLPSAVQHQYWADGFVKCFYAVLIIGPPMKRNGKKIIEVHENYLVSEHTRNAAFMYFHSRIPCVEYFLSNTVSFSQ